MAKGWGMLLIMIGHLGINKLPQATAIQVWLYSFHIPLFFFLSGYLFSTGKNLRDFALKKARTVVLPYFTLGTVILLYEVYSAVKSNYYSSEWFWGIFKRFLIQDRFWTIWFLASILVLNILMYIVVRVLKRSWKIAVAAVLIGAAGLTYYRLGGGKLYWDVDVALCAMPFFAGGFLLRRHGSDFSFLIRGKKRSVIWLVVCLMLNIVFCRLNYDVIKQPSDMFSMRYGIAPLMYLSAFFGIFAVVIFSRMVIFKPVCFIGTNSLVFFAWHQTIIMPLVSNWMSNVHFTIAAGDPAWKMLLYWGIELTLVTLILTALVKLINGSRMRVLIGRK